MILLLTIVIFILSLSCVILYTRYANIKTIAQIDAGKLSASMMKNEALELEKYKLAIKVEHVSATLAAKESAQEESIKHSKSILYDLTHSLTNQLIDIHKKEMSDGRKITEETIIKQSSSVNQELQKVANLVANLNKDFESSKAIVHNLESALLSPIATGVLAEITLENLLKNSGLRVGIDYQMQYGFNSENNTKLRPDAIIFLPEDSVLIIDAKTSQFLVRDDKLEDLSKTMNLHLKNLLSKDYTNELSKEFSKTRTIRRVTTVMFVPTDQSLIKIQESDVKFLEKAWENNIYPSGPSGLMNILSLAKMHIGENLRVANYENIINEVSHLLNSLATVSEHAFRLGNSLTSAISHYDKFAGSFNKNIVSKAAKLKNFGAISSNPKNAKLLERFQIVHSKNELIEIESAEKEESAKFIKDID